MIGSSELNIKTGDWVVLRNGEVRGPVTVSEDKSDQFPVHIKHDEFFFSWARDGRESDNGGESSFDIVAVLSCAPLERIRQLEAHVEQLQDKCNAVCACSYDHPDDVCLAHSPKLKAAEGRIMHLEDALRALMSWFPEKPSPPEWRLRAGEQGADDAVLAAKAVLEASQ